jgi:hypothetical protein
VGQSIAADAVAPSPQITTKSRLLIRDGDIKLEKVVSPSEVTPQIGFMTLPGRYPMLAKVIDGEAWILKCPMHSV